MIAGLKILPLFLILSFQGCNLWDYLQPPNREPVTPPGNRSEARELLSSYLTARLSGENTENLRDYLTDEAWNDYQSTRLSLRSENEEQFVGYKILDETDLAGGRYAFTTVMQAVSRARPQAKNTTEDLIISFRNDEYRISSARLLGVTKIRAEGTDLIWEGVGADNRESAVKVFNLQDFPAQMRPIGGEEGIEFILERSGYSAVVLHPEGEGAAFGTTGTHGALGVLTWGEKIPASEKVKLTPLDLFYGGRVQLLSFSPDAQYIAVEIATAAGTDRVEVYRTDQRNKLNLQLNEAFPAEQYNTAFHHWDAARHLVLRVTSGPGQTGDAEKVGIWRINIQTGEREKVIIE
ncbi:MAG: hypothetical protein GX050_07015 [Firmicutes bacterium]|nr:hypothetical protein [Bacillota bacterium]